MKFESTLGIGVIVIWLNKLFLLISDKAWPGTRGKTEKKLDNSAVGTNSASEKTATSTKNKIETNAVCGDYTSAEKLLGDLQHQYEWLRGFKPKMSQSGLRAIKKFGIYMAPRSTDYKLSFEKLDGGTGRKYPTFMAVAINHKAKANGHFGTSEMILYAEKLKWKHNAYNVEKPTGQYFYEFGYVVRIRKEYYPINTCLEVLKNGNIKILRKLEAEMVTLPKKKRREPVSRGANGRPLAGSPASVKVAKWKAIGLPPTAEMEDENKTGGKDLIEMTKEIFIWLYNVHLRRDASTSIHATRGNTRMIFTVPMHSWKDFFNDRITAKAPDGKKKRIFHHVAAHRRKNGQLVPMHTRGLTRFKWNGFNLKICEWKKGRVAFTDFDMAGEPMSAAEAGDHMLRTGRRLIGDEEFAIKLIPYFTQDLHKPSAS